jgi:drug/metabolite transporter (DMT)-like permease
MKKYTMVVLMVMAAFFWAGAFIAGKYSVGTFSPGMLTFLRFGIASVVIMSVLVLKHPEDWKIQKEQIKPVIILGLVGMVGYHVLFFEALKYTTASNASMVAAMNPIVTALIASVIAGESLSVKKIMLILLAFSGVVLTLTNWDLGVITRHEMNVGDLIMLVAVSCWAVYSVLVKKFMPAFTPLKLTAYTFLSCTIMMAPFIVFNTQNFMDLKSAPMPAIGAVLYMAIFPTVIGYLIQQMSIRNVGASRTNIYINLVPVFSLTLAVLILGEHAPVQKLVSSGMIIIAVFLYSREGMKVGKNHV